MFRSRFLIIPTVAVLIVGFMASPVSAASAIDARYGSDAELRTLCGSPTSGETPIMDGALKHYQNCTLYWSPDTGVHEAHGAIRDVYRDAGGVQTLGFPIADERPIWIRFEFNVIGYAEDFENGTVTWSDDYGDQVLTPHAATEWTGQLDNLLMPSNPVQQVPGGSRLRFETGTIYETSSSTATLFESLHGYGMKIPKKWGSKGGAWSFLGLPVAELENLDGGYRQKFQHGDIYWEGDYELGTARPEAYIVYGRILERYLSEGGPSALGFPYSDQSDLPSGQIAHFSHGDIIWDRTSDSTYVVTS